MPLQPGTTLGAFEVSGLLGAGGMGEVYRARDGRLGRDVAIKVLPEAFAADATRLARFEREARTLASLDHPGIAAIHDLQEDGGTRFLVMQLVGGQTLGERLRKGPLGLDEALPLFRQIAEALQYAHDRGVVHRDLKPENVKVTADGRVKILDFGLAKAFGDPSASAGDAANATTVDADVAIRTSAGQVLGTPAYMSPEQARGQAVDKRTDVWAFGCCLYEALTGRRPFRGTTPSDTIAEILKSEPDWSRLPADMPPHLATLLRRSLEKDPRRRLSSMGDLAITFEETTSDLGRATPTREAGGGRRRGNLVLGSIAVVVVALLATAGLVWFGKRGDDGATSRAGGIERIAVLPFANTSGEPDQEYFVDGMTALLITELARIDSLTVISRTSAMQFKDKHGPTREIAERLGADALVEGAVIRVGDDVRITASLVDGRTEQTMWSNRYDGTIEDALNLQSRIAEAVAAEIDVALSPEVAAGLARDRRVDPRAFDAYLRGIHEQNRQTGDSRARAISYYEEATRIDPEFAPAWARLAEAWLQQFGWGFVARSEVRDVVAAANAHAVELDSDLPLVWTNLAREAIHLDWDWRRAEQLFEKALDADPDDAKTHLKFALGLGLYKGAFERADRLGRRAAARDPSVPYYPVELSNIYMAASRFDEARELIDGVIATNPEFVPAWTLRSYLHILSGDHDTAVADARRSFELSRDPHYHEYLGAALALAGQTAEAREVLATFEALAEREYVQHAEIGMVRLALGDHDEAYDLFRQALDAREMKLLWLTHTGFFDAVDHEPRLAALLDQVTVVR